MPQARKTSSGPSARDDKPAIRPVTDGPEPESSGGSSVADASEDQSPGIRERAETAARTAADTVGEAAASASEKATELRDRVGEKVSDAYDTARGHAGEAYRSSREAVRDGARTVRSRTRQAGRGVEDYLDENPLMIGVFGFVGGLLLGSLLPRTRSEDRHFGPWRDELARQGIRRSRDFAQTAHDFADEQMTRVRRSVEPDSDYPGGGQSHRDMYR